MGGTATVTITLIVSVQRPQYYPHQSAAWAAQLIQDAEMIGTRDGYKLTRQMCLTEGGGGGIAGRG